MGDGNRAAHTYGDAVAAQDGVVVRLGGTLAAAAAATSLLLTACGAESPEPGPAGGTTTQRPDDGQTTSPTPSLRAVLDVPAEPGPGPEGYAPGTEGLVLRYAVRNEGDAPILVVRDRGHRQASGSPAPEVPEAVWVGGVDADTVRASKQLFTVPSGIDLHEPYRATADLVEPGATVEGVAFLPVPVRTDLPPSGETLVVDAQQVTGTETRVELCLQVAPDPRGEHPDAFTDEITTGHRDRSLLCAPPVELPSGSG